MFARNNDYQKDISSIEKRANEAYRRQLLAEPTKPCGLCNWSKKYGYAKEQWEQQVEQLEMEIRRLKVLVKFQMNKADN